MITNHRVVMAHPADSSVNLILTDHEGQLVDESDGRPQTQEDIKHAIRYFENHRDADKFTYTIRFLSQFLEWKSLNDD
jgi:hypothetical protein